MSYKNVLPMFTLNSASNFQNATAPMREGDATVEINGSFGVFHGDEVGSFDCYAKYWLKERDYCG